MTFELALRAIIIPFIIAAVIAVPAWQPWNQGVSKQRGALGTVFAIGLSFCIAYFLIERGWPSLPPSEQREWLAHFALITTGLGIVTVRWREPKWFNWLIVPGVMIGSLFLIRSVDADLPTWFVQRAMITFGLIAATWLAVEPLARKRDGITVPLVCLIAALGSVPVVLISGFESWAMLMMSLGAACACLFLLSLWKPSVSPAHGGLFVVLALLIAVLMLTAEYRSDRYPSFLYYLPPLTVAAGWIGELRAVRKLTTWQRIAIVTVAALVPVAIAIFFTILAAPDASLYMQ